MILKQLYEQMRKVTIQRIGVHNRTAKVQIHQRLGLEKFDVLFEPHTYHRRIVNNHRNALDVGIHRKQLEIGRNEWITLRQVQFIVQVRFGPVLEKKKN